MMFAVSYGPLLQLDTSHRLHMVDLMFRMIDTTIRINQLFLKKKHTVTWTDESFTTRPCEETGTLTDRSIASNKTSSSIQTARITTRHWDQRCTCRTYRTHKNVSFCVGMDQKFIPVYGI